MKPSNDLKAAFKAGLIEQTAIADVKNVIVEIANDRDFKWVLELHGGYFVYVHAWFFEAWNEDGGSVIREHQSFGELKKSMSGNDTIMAHLNKYEKTKSEVIIAKDLVKCENCKRLEGELFDLRRINKFLQDKLDKSVTLPDDWEEDYNLAELL